MAARAARLAPRLARASAAAVLLAVGACHTVGYGGDGRVLVDLTIEPPRASEASATTEPVRVDLESWVVDSGGWMEIDGRERLPRLADLRRRGEAEAADALLEELVLAIGQRSLVRFTTLESAEWLPQTTLFLLVRHGGRLASKQFNSTTERDVRLAL